jgi:hypothetical protein
MKVSTIITDIIQIVNRKHSDLQGLNADDHPQYDRVDGTRHYIKNLLTTQGDLLIRGANGLERLPIGDAGKFLKSQGPGKNPIWDSLNIVSGYSETITDLGGDQGTYYSTGFSVDILSGQKLFAVFSGHVYYPPYCGYIPISIVAIQMDDSDISETIEGNIRYVDNSDEMYVPISVCVLSSPSAGSHTIRIRFTNTGSTARHLKGNLVVLVF